MVYIISMMTIIRIKMENMIHIILGMIQVAKEVILKTTRTI